MSKIHILEADNFSYKVAMHYAMPVGNNSVGISWKDAAMASGRAGTTSLIVGTSASNITQVEYDNLITGDIIEIIETVDVGTNPSDESVELLCDVLIAEWQAKMSQTLKYYGHTIEGE